MIVGSREDHRLLGLIEFSHLLDSSFGSPWGADIRMSFGRGPPVTSMMASAGTVTATLLSSTAPMPMVSVFNRKRLPVNISGEDSITGVAPAVRRNRSLLPMLTAKGARVTGSVPLPAGHPEAW